MYYIYHIPGIKIGCSVNPKRRVKEQGYKSFEILEEHNDNDIELAAKREIELRNQYGYKEDNVKTDYVQHYQFGKIGRANMIPGKGAETQIKNKIGIWALSKEERSKIQKNASSYGGYAQSQIVYTCPHCGKVGKGNGMLGYHFDKCKLA
jgi:hypothetical protein